jgi:hypothetical protein
VLRDAFHCEVDEDDVLGGCVGIFLHVMNWMRPKRMVWAIEPMSMKKAKHTRQPRITTNICVLTRGMVSAQGTPLRDEY